MTPEQNAIKVGTKVKLDGFEGRVVTVCDWNAEMIEVRLPTGYVCVGKDICEVIA